MTAGLCLLRRDFSGCSLARKLLDTEGLGYQVRRGGLLCRGQISSKIFSCALIYLFIYLFILELHSWHMLVPRLGVQSELLLPAHTTATSTPDPRHICDLHHSSRPCWILNPLIRPGIEPTTSWFLVGFVSAAPRRILPEPLFPCCTCCLVLLQTFVVNW